MTYALSFLLLLCVSLHAATLEWDYNPEPEVAGYKVYSGTQRDVFTEVRDVGNTNAFDLSWMRHSRWFALTAYDADGLESDFSESVFYDPRVVSLRVQKMSANFEVWSSEDLTTWRSEGIFTFSTETAPIRFFVARPARTTPTSFGSKAGKLQ